MKKDCCKKSDVWVGNDHNSNGFRYRFFCKNCKKVWFKDGTLLRIKKEQEILRKHLTID